MILDDANPVEEAADWVGVESVLVKGRMKEDVVQNLGTEIVRAMDLT
jgi:hypothetical protein